MSRYPISTEEQMKQDPTWGFRMAGQIGSTLVKSNWSMPPNAKKGPNNAGPNLPKVNMRTQQESIIARLQKKFDELSSQASRNMAEEKRLEELIVALEKEKKVLANMGPRTGVSGYGPASGSTRKGRKSRKTRKARKNRK